MREEIIGNCRLILGDCMESLRKMPDNSVDSIVTDPPYGLAFMGKKWDYDVPSVEVWAECLRVLKPGGYLLAFAGTRTQHRMAVRIEDAGFEIRDMIAWVYGSGFPKSLDVSKAIDKLDATEEQELRRLAFTAWVRSQGVTSRQIDEATRTNMGGHYTTAASQPAIMTREHLEACRPLFREVPSWVEQEADKRTVESENFKRREVVGRSAGGLGAGNFTAEKIGAGGYGFGTEFDLTLAHTEAARQWQGWGTALKPALEPITMARKPLVGTVAANVMKHGTGALNIDGCRVGDSKQVPASSSDAPNNVYGASSPRSEDRGGMNPNIGRWPANLIHDGSEEVVGLFPVTTSGGGNKSRKGTTEGGNCYGTYGAPPPDVRGADKGSAARFFYCPKASKRDRDEGLEGAEVRLRKTHGDTGPSDNAKPNGQRPVESRNHHPTVKPTDLMAYLCRLVTPPGGVVLDPFMGSGSTGKAAMREGFRFIGCELSPEYMTIARARIEDACRQPRLIMDEQPIRDQGSIFEGAA